MSNWMQKAIEDRSRFAERRKREATDQQLHSRTVHLLTVRRLLGENFALLIRVLRVLIPRMKRPDQG